MDIPTIKFRHGAIRPNYESGKLITISTSDLLRAFSFLLKFATTRTAYVPLGKSLTVALMKTLLIEGRVVLSGVTNFSHTPTRNSAY